LAELTGFKFSPSETSSDELTRESIQNADVVFAAGAAGIELMTEGWISNASTPAVAIDLNAVPPAGIFGVSVTDQGEKRNNTVCYGAIGVGGLKMKIHKQAIKNLFHTNDLTLETEETYRLGVELIK